MLLTSNRGIRHADPRSIHFYDRRALPWRRALVLPSANGSSRLLRVVLCGVMAVSFVVLIAPAALAAIPTIASITPKVAVVGEEVTITGTGFATATNVTFASFDFGDRVEAKFVIDSPTQIRATVPDGVRSGR